MRSKLFVLACLVSGLGLSVFAANAITNDDVVKMVTNHLKTSIVKTALETADATAFDVTPDGLLALKSGGVDKDIILMIQKIASEKQPKSTFVMTNDAVVQMVTGKINRDVITTAIENTPKRNFDTSPDGLVNLKLAKVDDKIVELMQASPQSKPQPVAAKAELLPAKPVSLNDPKPTAPVVVQSKQPEATPVVAKVAEPVATSATSPKKLILKDDEPAFIRTSLSTQAVVTKLKVYFDGKDMSPKMDPDTGTLTTEYGLNRKCGIGFNSCEDKVSAKISAENGETVIRLRVLRRKKEGGISPKPWNEENKSNGADTASMATDLETLLASGPTKVASR